MGGMYIVPLNALMQKKAPKQYVASVIAGNNIINSLGMVAISIFAAVLVAVGFKITDLFLFVAFISAGVAFYICKLLPDALLRSIFCSILNLFFRVKVNGLQNLRKAGSKALVVANHVSLLDGLLIAAYLPRKITFAIDSEWGAKWFVRMFSGIVDFYPLNPANPLAIRSLIEVVNQGKTVMIFPEGRISVTGSLMKVYEGAGVVAAKSGAKIIPLRIDGAQYFGATKTNTDDAVSGVAAITSVNGKIDDATSLTVAAHSTTYYKIVARLWLEGEDTTCNNTTFANLADGGTWALSMAWVLGDSSHGVTNITETATAIADLSAATVDSSTTVVINGLTYTKINTVQLDSKDLYVQGTSLTNSSKIYQIVANFLTNI